MAATIFANNIVHKKREICRYSLTGRCNKNSCRFSHSQPKVPAKSQHLPASKTPQQTICHYWVTGNCVYGENCHFLHSWFESQDDFSMLTRLDGHKKAVTGIALLSDKLFSAGRDGVFSVWNCHTGERTNFVNLGREIGCLIAKESWVFVGIPDVVKAWNVNNGKEVCLEGSIVGQVYAMATNINNNLLFVGAQDGVISVWKCDLNRETDTPFEFVTSLQGHTKPVTSLIVGEGRLYSASMDRTIRVWNEELQCVQVLKGHSDVVTSILCWDTFLLSCSLDGKLLVWASDEKGYLQVVYTHKEEEQILGIFGMMDADAKPVLYCSCKDNSTRYNTVRLYELPSFSKRGKIFAKGEVRAIQQGPAALFFTSDATGSISVWQWLEKAMQCGQAS